MRSFFSCVVKILVFGEDDGCKGGDGYDGQGSAGSGCVGCLRLVGCGVGGSVCRLMQ